MDAPADLHGHSMVSILKGKTPNDWRKSFYYHYYEYPGYHWVRRHYGVADGRYKLIRFYEQDVDQWELFDLKTDPNEMTSVYGTAKYAVVQNRLSRQLALHRQELAVPDQDPPQSVVKRLPHEPVNRLHQSENYSLLSFRKPSRPQRLLLEQTLFSGTDFKAFELRTGSWEIESDGSMVCLIEKTKDKKGVERLRGMGYIWTKDKFEDFILELEYKLSEGANSGIFYRTDKNDPVQKGFEIQLMDNEGFQKKAKSASSPN